MPVTKRTPGRERTEVTMDITNTKALIERACIREEKLEQELKAVRNKKQAFKTKLSNLVVRLSSLAAQDSQKKRKKSGHASKRPNSEPQPLAPATYRLLRIIEIIQPILNRDLMLLMKPWHSSPHTLLYKMIEYQWVSVMGPTQKKRLSLTPQGEILLKFNRANGLKSPTGPGAFFQTVEFPVIHQEIDDAIKENEITTWESKYAKNTEEGGGMVGNAS